MAEYLVRSNRRYYHSSLLVIIRNHECSSSGRIWTWIFEIRSWSPSHSTVTLGPNCVQHIQQATGCSNENRFAIQGNPSPKGKTHAASLQWIILLRQDTAATSHLLLMWQSACIIMQMYIFAMPITAAARSKAWTVFASSKLVSWVRIPLKAWMSVWCVYSVFVLFCVQVKALRRADPPSKESYQMCIGSRKWKSGKGPTKRCRTITIIFLEFCRRAYFMVVHCNMCQRWPEFDTTSGHVRFIVNWNWGGFSRVLRLPLLITISHSLIILSSTP
jgi:hypothetical protein